MPHPPWKPLRLAFNPDRQIESAFRELIHSPWGLGGATDIWEPAIDLYETAEGYIVEADVPGLGCNELCVSVEEHWLTISGSRETTGIAHAAQRVRVERRQGSFSRRFYLSEPVDAEGVEHSCVEGLHRIHLRKAPSAGTPSP